jgi:hypothetical protein
MTGAVRIFVSYRREDAAATAGRIRDRLATEYGSDHVFFDVYTIPLGVDFRSHIDEVLARCDWFLAIIGPWWLTASDETGNSRLAQHGDFVRLEIETALDREIPLVPVLVDGAVMPRAAELPPSIAALAFRNGVQVRHDPDFHSDVSRLIRGLDAGQMGTGPAVLDDRRNQPGVDTDVVGSDRAVEDVWDVCLSSPIPFGQSRYLRVIRLLQELTGRTFTECKDMVDGAPSRVLVGLDRATAEEAKAALSGSGATVTLERPRLWNT